jgi:hypothetical protein
VLINSGTAFYTSFYLLGAASIIIDGQGEMTYNITLEDILAGFDQQPIFSKPDMPNGPHTLVIAPTTKNGTLVGLDHLVYTYAFETLWLSTMLIRCEVLSCPQKAMWARL